MKRFVTILGLILIPMYVLGVGVQADVNLNQEHGGIGIADNNGMDDGHPWGGDDPRDGGGDDGPPEEPEVLRGDVSILTSIPFGVNWYILPYLKLLPEFSKPDANPKGTSYKRRPEIQSPSSYDAARSASNIIPGRMLK